MLSCFAHAFPARDVESSDDLFVVKTESELLNLVHAIPHYEKSTPYSFHRFGGGHGGYGSTHKFQRSLPLGPRP
jgi:hypothetical protein